VSRRSATFSETLWHVTYDELMRNAPDLVGALRARAVAHVLRLAGIHAVLDGRREAAERHLRAAPAVWASCADPPAHFLATGSATRSRTIGPASSGPPTWRD